MNQINAILKIFQEWHENMGLEYLWYASNDELTNFYPELELKYDADTAFFKALEILLKSGDKCLFYNLNSKEPSKDGEHLTGTPEEQIALLKETWVGKAEMEKMDEENDYLGWCFLIFCPYSLAHKIYDEQSHFVNWWHAE